jgi:hypothetical protein
MRFQVRKRAGRWEVWSLREGAKSWWKDVDFPTFWQAMLQVTGDLPYGSETPWSPSLRPVWCN